MKQFKKIVSKISVSVFMVSAPLISLAQIQNPLKGFNNIPGFISLMLGYVVRIGGVIAIFAFTYSGYLFVKARGSEKGLTEAKTVFFNTVIGVGILLGAQIIAALIGNTLDTLR